MKSLLYLYSRLIINEYRKKFFSKNTLFGAAFLIFFSIFALGIGFGLGYLFNYSHLHPLAGEKFTLYKIKFMLAEIVFPTIFIKSSSRTQFLRKLNLSSLKLFPISKFKIFLFDINSGFFDLISLYLAELLLGLIAGAGGFSLSINAAVILVINSISLVYFFHLFCELLHSIIRLLSSLPKIYTTIAILIIASFVYMFVLKDISMRSLVNNNPLSWNVGSVFLLIIFNKSHWLLTIILFNVTGSLICTVLIIIIKTFHEKLFSAHIIQINTKIRSKRLQLPNIALIFPQRIQPYLEKDLKYILRSSRSLSALIIELLMLVFVGYMHFSHSNSYNHFYFPAGFIIIFPLMIWDFFLSNCWGFEKKGFGFYMFSNTDTGSLTPSKNLSYILVRFPVILIETLALCVLFSFKYLPLILFLHIILILMSLSFSNLVSVKNPFPVDFKESSMSKRQQQKISWVGFLSMMTDLILPAGILFMVYKLSLGLLTYSIFAVLLIVIIVFYKIMVSYSSSLLNKQKEIIYKKLIKI